MPDRFSLRGDVAFVTGASGGLGRHFAGVLAAAGARVALAARRLEALEDAAEVVRCAGGQAAAVACDVASAESLRGAMDTAEARLGPVTVLVNNSGVIARAPVLDHGEEDWDRVLGTNLRGAFLASREAARRMVAGGRGGRIVNVASILGIGVRPGVAGYAASKAGLLQLTRALALELGPRGIAANALAPGFVETDMNRDLLRGPFGAELARRIPLGRLGEPADLDGALLLLTSPAGRYLNGVTIPVDGGHLVGGL